MNIVMITNLVDRIDELEKIIERVDSKVCFSLNTIHDEISKIKTNYNNDTFKKISELEEKTLSKNNLNSIPSIWEEINNLRARLTEIIIQSDNNKKEIKELTLQLSIINGRSIARIPYKCPICDGKGKHYIDPNAPLGGFEAAFAPRDIEGRAYRPCDPCEQKGIVWG